MRPLPIGNERCGEVKLRHGSEYNVVGDPSVLPEKQKRHIQLVLKDVKAPDPEGKGQYPPMNGKAYDLSREDFPVPELVLITLRDGLGCERFGPFEKCRWSVPVVYRGVPFAFEYRKCGLVAQTVTNESLVALLLPEFFGKLKKAVNATADALKDLCQSQITSLSVTVANLFPDLDRMYRFFRENATESYRTPDSPMRVTAVDEKGEPKAWAGSFLQGPRKGFYHTTAMLNAYFSRLEHVLVLVLPFTTFDETEFDLLDYIGSTWDDKYRRLFDVEKDKEAKRLYDRMKVAKERYRNPIAHGGFEKGGASLYFHVPTVGALPASLVAVRDSWTFSFIPIPEASYEEICALFDEVDAFLTRSLTKYGWRFAGSGLDVVFDGKTRDEYRRAMATDEAFEAMLKKLSLEEDFHRNMEH
jgi:hypothetical protein